MILTPLSVLANHLWQSTLFAGLMMLVSLAVRKNRASTRHWLWVAASVKFLIPFSWLIALGGQFQWHNPVCSRREGHSICCASGNDSTICNSSHSTAARAGAGVSESNRGSAASGLGMRVCSRCLLLGGGVVENPGCCSAVRAAGCPPSDSAHLI